MAIAPCRREKQLRGFPVFYTVVHEDIDQFHSVNPTHVFKYEALRPSAAIGPIYLVH
jgi:hypothetical protein